MIFIKINSVLICETSVSIPTFETNSHRICEAQTLANSLNVVLRAGYLSVRMAGGASDRH